MLSLYLIGYIIKKNREIERDDVMQLWFILSLVFAVLIALFAVLNSDDVVINLIFTQLPTKQSVVILGSAAIGAIIAAFLGIFKRLKSSFKTRELKNQVKELEEKIQELTNEKSSEKVPEAASESAETDTEKKDESNMI